MGKGVKTSKNILTAGRAQNFLIEIFLSFIKKWPFHMSAFLLLKVWNRSVGMDIFLTEKRKQRIFSF